MRKQDTKRTLTPTAAVPLQDIIELEAALQAGGIAAIEQKRKTDLGGGCDKLAFNGKGDDMAAVSSSATVD